MTPYEFAGLFFDLGIPVRHNDALKMAPPYLVYTEYERPRFIADNSGAEGGWKIQLDYYTKKEFDPLAETIEGILDANDIAFSRLKDFEKDTGYHHHIFDCEVI